VLGFILGALASLFCSLLSKGFFALFVAKQSKAKIKKKEKRKTGNRTW
jgi:hypothetical protein